MLQGTNMLKTDHSLFHRTTPTLGVLQKFYFISKRENKTRKYTGCTGLRVVLFLTVSQVAAAMGT